jgi:hypothetical protein
LANHLGHKGFIEQLFDHDLLVTNGSNYFDDVKVCFESFFSFFE